MQRLPSDFGRNQRFLPRAGGVLGDRLHGLHRLFPIVSRDIRRRCRAGASATPYSQPDPAFRYSISAAPRAFRIIKDRARRREPAPKPLQDPRPAHIRRLRVLISDG